MALELDFPTTGIRTMAVDPCQYNTEGGSLACSSIALIAALQFCKITRFWQASHLDYAKILADGAELYQLWRQQKIATSENFTAIDNLATPHEVYNCSDATRQCFDERFVVSEVSGYLSLFDMRNNRSEEGFPEGVFKWESLEYLCEKIPPGSGFALTMGVHTILVWHQLENWVIFDSNGTLDQPIPGRHTTIQSIPRLNTLCGEIRVHWDDYMRQKTYGVPNYDYYSALVFVAKNTSK